jgi:hypothetical protein
MGPEPRGLRVTARVGAYAAVGARGEAPERLQAGPPLLLD